MFAGKRGMLTCLALSRCGIGCQICASCWLRWWNRTACCAPWPSGSAWTDFRWPLSRSCWGVPRRWWRGFQLRGGGTRAISGPPWRCWSGLWPSGWCGSPRRPRTPELGHRSCGSRTLCGRSLHQLLCLERGWSWSPVHSGGSAETYSGKRRRPTKIIWSIFVLIYEHKKPEWVQHLVAMNGQVTTFPRPFLQVSGPWCVTYGHVEAGIGFLDDIVGATEDEEGHEDEGGC